MSNVKAGDLAILVNSCTGRSIGRIVEVVTQCPPAGNFLLPCGCAARITVPGNLAWVIRFIGGKGYTSSGKLCTHAHAFDEHLRPLPGDTDELTTDRDVTA